eukprot:m.121986 g.121986  ORF g.121986 m.121986 type:complete len:980 (-) comp12932_c2_seq4:1602-4541(-)
MSLLCVCSSVVNESDSVCVLERVAEEVLKTQSLQQVGTVIAQCVDELNMSGSAVVRFSSAALTLFLQDNYTGPPVDRSNITVSSLLQETLITKDEERTSELQKKPKKILTDTNDTEKEVVQTHPIMKAAKRGDASTDLNRAIRSTLCINGETPYRWIQSPLLLLCAYAAMRNSQKKYSDVPLCGVVEMRTVTALQEMFDITTTTLHEQMTHLSKQLGVVCDALETCGCADVAAQIQVERAHAHMHYHEYRIARECVANGMRCVGVNVTLTGAMGKRTKFQQSSLPQLTVQIHPYEHGENLFSTTTRGIEDDGEKATKNNVKQSDAMDTPHSSDNYDSSDGSESTGDAIASMSNEDIHNQCSMFFLNMNPLENKHEDDIPKEVVLEDDTLLQQIVFDTENNETLPPSSLSPIAQALVLAHVRCKLISSPNNQLLVEEMIAFIDVVLAHVQSYSIQVYALLLKTRLEKTHTRRLHRSTQQLADIGDLFMRDIVVAAERIHDHHLVNTSPSWKILSELAQRYITIGLARDALEIYIRLEMWDGVIAAHQLLGEEETAEKIVRARLDLDPNDPSLWCALGEITRKEEHFEKAFEVSGGKMAKPMRALGLMLLHQAEHANTSRNVIEKEKYLKAMDCFQKSLALNSFQSSLWFSLGCSAMRVEDFATATNAFRRRIDLDDNDFESWNNLANGYMKLGQRKRAYYAFHQATKQAYDNWKVWENFSVVCVAVNKTAECIRAVERVLDIRGKYTDWKVIAALTHKLLNPKETRDNCRETTRKLEKNSHGDQSDNDYEEDDNVLESNEVKDNEEEKSLELRESFPFELTPEELHKQQSHVVDILEKMQTANVSDFRVWMVAARFYNRLGLHDQAKTVRRLAYQILKSVPAWEKSEASSANLVDCIEDMVTATVNMRKEEEETASLFSDEQKTFYRKKFNSTKLIVKGVVKTLKGVVDKKECDEGVKEQSDRAQKILDIIMENIEELSN